MLFAHRLALRRAKCRATKSGQVQKQYVVFNERRFVSLTVCMPHMDKQCNNFYSRLTPRAFGVHGLLVSNCVYQIEERASLCMLLSHLTL